MSANSTLLPNDSTEIVPSNLLWEPEKILAKMAVVVLGPVVRSKVAVVPGSKLKFENE